MTLECVLQVILTAIHSKCHAMVFLLLFFPKYNITNFHVFVKTGSANLVTPATPFHISSASLEATQQRQIVHNVSPVSCTRSVTTGLLDFREEVEADCVNLNKPVGEHSLSAPPPKRRVVPGPARRSPFVMQYRLSERASGNATHLYLVFSQMSGAVLSK